MRTSPKPFPDLAIIFTTPSVNHAETLGQIDLSKLGSITVPDAIGDSTSSGSTGQRLLDELIQEEVVRQTNAISYGSINNVGGILILQELMTKNSTFKQNSESIISDQSDSEEYDSRYYSLDMKLYREDGSDIAFIRIIDKDRKPIFPNFQESPAPGITCNKFKQFIVMQTSLQSNERVQIVETNKEYQVLFFGKKPEVLQVAGMLKNTYDNPWTINMIFLWDELMRGTKLAENGYLCQLFIDGELFEGYPLNFSRSKVAGSDFLVNFSFSFLIKTRSMVYNYESYSVAGLHGQY